jgi:hypothetical protein
LPAFEVIEQVPTLVLPPPPVLPPEPLPPEPLPEAALAVTVTFTLTVFVAVTVGAGSGSAVTVAVAVAVTVTVGRTLAAATFVVSFFSPPPSLPQALAPKRTAKAIVGST